MHIKNKLETNIGIEKYLWVRTYDWFSFSSVYHTDTLLFRKASIICIIFNQ